MNFEEQFPSLKEKTYVLNNSRCFVKSDTNKEFGSHFIFVDDIARFCLDKQRVREILQKRKAKMDEDYRKDKVSSTTVGTEVVVRELWQELGL